MFHHGLPVALCTAALLLTACLPGQPGRAPGAPPGLLYLRAPAGLLALDPQTDQVAFQVPGATLAADGSRLLAAASEADHTRLSTLDSQSGAERAHRLLAGSWAIQAVATDGQHVALGAPPAGGDLPVGRAQTAIVVAATAGTDPPRRYDLAGNYVPEAFSTDGARLFVLEYLPPLAPDHYRVRQLDLATGRIAAVPSRAAWLATRDKQLPPDGVPEEEMRGTGRQHVRSPDGQVLYTLYTHQPDHLHTRDLARGRTASRGDVHAFVHVLHLGEGWAYCLDLPAPLGLGAPAGHALALSPDGRQLYVADRASGQLVVADTARLELVRTARIEPGDAEPAATLLHAGPHNTLYLGSGRELAALDARTLRLRQRWPLDSPLRAIVASDDGRRLYAALDDRVLAIDARNGGQLGSLPTTEGRRGAARLAQED